MWFTGPGYLLTPPCLPLCCVAVVQSLKKTLSSKEEEKVGVDNLLAEALGDKRDLGSRLEKSEQIIAQLREESLDKDVQIEALQREFDEFSEKYKKELEGVQRERESVQGKRRGFYGCVGRRDAVVWGEKRLAEDVSV